MVKIGVLLPEERMVALAKTIIEENRLEAAYVKAVHTVDAVNEARKAIEMGAHILVARGYQAKLIREYTNIPVIEMRFHAQEIGLLIQKAKTIVKKEHPYIVLIAFENMLCDLSYMETLFEVRLHIIYLNRVEEAESIITGLKEKPDIIIGGEATCRAAERMGYLSLVYQSTEESVKEALLTAQKAAFAAESEKQNSAQFETVLDTSFNGIVKINAEGRIIVINKLIENLLGRNNEEVTGETFAHIFPEINKEFVDEVLEGKREEYATSVNMRKEAWMILIAPIQYDSQITGAIISFQKLTGKRKASQRQEDMRLHGFFAQTGFQVIHTQNQQMKEVLERAKIYAISESPIVIYGQAGTEDYLIAEAIHNNSHRSSGPYVSINLYGMEKEQQMEELFQREERDVNTQYSMEGAMVKANHGTLFLKGIEHLSMRMQYQMLRTMLPEEQIRTDAQMLDTLNVRIICSSKEDLKYLVQRGEFSEELYYMLQGLTLHIPSLNERPEDLRRYFEEALNLYKEKYNKPFHITKGGYEKLQELKWNGNRVQLRTFCERLVLTAKKRTIDEVVMQNLYNELYPQLREAHGEKQVIVYHTPEAEKLGELLELYHGNRRLVAEELGISTTTLWRRMKKYGIEANYGKTENLSETTRNANYEKNISDFMQ